LIFKVVSQLVVEIIKCELDFPMVAMDEPDPCREPLPRESRYKKTTGEGEEGVYL